MSCLFLQVVKKRIPLIIFAIFLFPGLALGAEKKEKKPKKNIVAKKSPKKKTPKSPRKKFREKIIITATRYEENTFDSSRGITVVGKREIRERNPRTPAEALRYKPGIWIQKTGHLGGAPVLRGFMGNRVIYLFDGIRRNTAGLFKGPNSFLQNIDALDVDRIEVIRGPGSVLYGSDAIGGVINVISNEKPRYADKSFLYGGRLFARYASVDREESGRIESYVATKKFYLFSGGTTRDIGHLQGGRGRGLQAPSQWREYNWDGQINYRISKKQEVVFFIQEFARPSGRRYDKPDRKQGSTRELYGLRYKGKKLGIFKDIQWTSYYHNQRKFRRKDGKANPDSLGKDKTYGTEFQAMMTPFKGAKVIGGFHFHFDELQSRNLQRGTQNPSVRWLNPAVFTLFKWEIAERLQLEMGVRWDMFNLKSSAPPLSALDQPVQDAINNGELSRKDLELDDTTNAVTGGVGFVFSIADWLNAVFHFGRAFRAPNQSDMLRFGQFTFGFNVPTTGLKPESSFTYEFGLRADHDDFAGSATLFYTTIDDAITSVPGTFGGKSYVDINGNGARDAGEDVFVKTNSSSPLEVWGVELEGKYYLPQKWTEKFIGHSALMAYGNFTWIYGRDRGQGEPLDRAFPANGLFGIRLENSRDPEQRRWWVALESWMVRSFGRIPSTRINRDPAFKVDPQDRNSGLLRSNGSVPGFTIFNVRAGYHISKYATFTVGVNNITNKRYRVKDSRIDAPGLNFVFSLEIRM